MRKRVVMTKLKANSLKISIKLISFQLDQPTEIKGREIQITYIRNKRGVRTVDPRDIGIMNTTSNSMSTNLIMQNK